MHAMTMVYRMHGDRHHARSPFFLNLPHGQVYSTGCPVAGFASFESSYSLMQLTRKHQSKKDRIP